MRKFVELKSEKIGVYTSRILQNRNCANEKINGYCLQLAISDKSFVNPELMGEFYERAESLAEKYFPDSHFEKHDDVPRQDSHANKYSHTITISFSDKPGEFGKLNNLLDMVNNVLSEYCKDTNDGPPDLDDLISKIEKVHMFSSQKFEDGENVLPNKVDPALEYINRLFYLGDSLIDSFNKQDIVRRAHISILMNEEKNRDQSFKWKSSTNYEPNIKS